MLKLREWQLRGFLQERVLIVSESQGEIDI